jgi:hypothetical protein
LFKWRDTDCNSTALKYVCQRPLCKQLFINLFLKLITNILFLFNIKAYQDKCTQYTGNPLAVDPNSQYHGTCIHKDQCPNGLFTSVNLCLDANNQNLDIVCCLTATAGRMC